MDIHAPFKTYKTFNNFKLNVWFSHTVIEKIMKRDRLYKQAKLSGSEVLWEEYKRERNQVTSLIRQETRIYYDNQINENKHDGKAMWKTLKLLIGHKKNPNSKPIIFDGIE